MEKLTATHSQLGFSSSSEGQHQNGPLQDCRAAAPLFGAPASWCLCEPIFAPPFKLLSEEEKLHFCILQMSEVIVWALRFVTNWHKAHKGSWRVFLEFITHTFFGTLGKAGLWSWMKQFQGKIQTTTRKEFAKSGDLLGIYNYPVWWDNEVSDKISRKHRASYTKLFSQEQRNTWTCRVLRCCAISWINPFSKLTERHVSGLLKSDEYHYFWRVHKTTTDKVPFFVPEFDTKDTCLLVTSIFFNWNLGPLTPPPRQKENN